MPKSKYLYDIVNVVFPGSPKAYAYRYTAAMIHELGRPDATLAPGDRVVVSTKDGLQVVEVASLKSRDNESDFTMEQATAWIVDVVDTVVWKKWRTKPAVEDTVDDLLDELL